MGFSTATNTIIVARDVCCHYDTKQEHALIRSLTVNEPVHCKYLVVTVTTLGIDVIASSPKCIFLFTSLVSY